MTIIFISHSSKDKEWASQIHKELEEHGYRSLFLDFHPDDGVPAGAKWESTLWQHLKQSRGVVVLCTANWLASPWCVAEVMVAREMGKMVFLLKAPNVTDGHQVKDLQATGQESQIPDFLIDTQPINLGCGMEEEAYQLLWRGLENIKGKFPQPTQPYPGLEPFQETDAAVFFGRDDQIQRVMAVLTRCRLNNANRFILVLGASGSGKSSLVRAGVLPRLKPVSDKDGPDGRWVIVPPFTGNMGFTGLATSLASAFKEAGRPVEFKPLRSSLESASSPAFEEAGRPLGLLCALASELRVARGLPEGRVLLVLDQLEEVFGTPDGSGARAMLRLLLDASAEAESPIVILATMRSDFLNDFQQFEGAADRYEGITLDPMQKSRFGEIIENPAKCFGLNLDGGLTQRLVDDTGYDDALPLLAFTLKKLYEKDQANGVLTLTSYQQLGSVSAAIKNAADEILREVGYAWLPADDPRMRDLRRAFYRLAHVGEGGQFTRRTAHKEQIPPSCADVLKRFVNQRLLVSDTKTLSVAHEALFRVWDTLHKWLIDDREALVLRNQIENAATEWDAENRDESRMWPEVRILDAMRKIGLSGVDVADSKTVRAFLGPIDPNEIVKLSALTPAEDEKEGSGLYDDAWRLPLSHEARASLGVRRPAW